MQSLRCVLHDQELWAFSLGFCLQFPSNFSAAPSLATLQNCLSIFSQHSVSNVHTLKKTLSMLAATTTTYTWMTQIQTSSPGLSLGIQPLIPTAHLNMCNHISPMLKIEFRIFPSNPDDLPVLPTLVIDTTTLTVAQPRHWESFFVAPCLSFLISRPGRFSLIYSLNLFTALYLLPYPWSKLTYISPYLAP